MIRNFSADYILPINQNPIRNGVISVSEAGTITQIYESSNAKDLHDQSIIQCDGVIVPGFVNSHCHLELSHLYQKLPQKKGLPDFVYSVIQKRNEESETRQLEAMKKADKEMFNNGIVAVGDICNTSLSKEVKEKASIYYHSFIELLGFDPEKAKEVFNYGLELWEKFKPLSVSLVPHAPYTVSKELFRYLKYFCENNPNIFTIHNQESEEENKLYRYKIGDFVDLYKKMKINIDFFKPQARDSLQSIIPLIFKKQKVMLVHNTYTNLKDISFIKRLGREVTWCFCPNANLYIENKLPNIDFFVANDLNITIGTDSLASNHQLCILSELKTIHRHFPTIPFATSVTWATLNGAKQLGIDHQFGTLEKGKKPGLNLITNMNRLNLTENSAVEKLV